MAEAYLSIGGNVGDTRVILDQAVAFILDGRDVVLLARSSDYLTPPWGRTDQPAFINLCIAVETMLSPHQLLSRAQDVESRLGRDRRAETRWGPRTCDIDVLAYDDLTLAEPGLTLPHPRMFERGFVLVPLAEIAADKVIGGKRVSAWLQDADTGGIRKLPPK